MLCGLQVKVLKDEVAVVKAKAGTGGGGGAGGGENIAFEAFKAQMYEDMQDLDATMGRYVMAGARALAAAGASGQVRYGKSWGPGWGWIWG